MQTILLYISIINISVTVMTVYYVWRLMRFPETPSRPYWLLTAAFVGRLYAQLTGIGFIDEVLKLEFPTTQLIISTVVGLAITLAFFFAYLEKFVMLKKKYGTLKK